MQMFNLRIAAVFSFVLAAFSTSARAAQPIEFEFGGVFTRSINTVHQVGEPFTTTVLFDPDTPDTVPSPLEGHYPYLSWTAPSRTSTPIVFEDIPATIGSIQILRGSGGGHTWKVDFQGATQFLYELSIDFPEGTFPTDALPQSLDLSAAFATSFEAFDGAFNVDLRGTINSLTVRVVPEPACVGIVTGVVLALRRRSI
jgi:hypothetical protein